KSSCLQQSQQLLRSGLVCFEPIPIGPDRASIGDARLSASEEAHQVARRSRLNAFSQTQCTDGRSHRGLFHTTAAKSQSYAWISCYSTGDPALTESMCHG